MTSLVLWYIVMGIGLAGMIWCAKAQKSSPNAKLYAVVCLGVVVLSAIMVLVSFFSDPEQERAMANSNQFELSKINRIAQFVNESYAGKSVVILVRQDQLPQPNSDFVRIDPVKELKSRLKDVTVKDTVIMAPPTEEEIKAMGGDPEAMAGFEISMSPEFYNKKFNECKALEPDAVIALAGLPMGESCDKLVIWKWAQKGPRIILPEVGDIGLSVDPFQLGPKGVVDCLITTRNDRKFNFMDDTAPKDLKEAFDTLYIFVTKDNLAQLVKDKTISVMEPMK